MVLAQLYSKPIEWFWDDGMAKVAEEQGVYGAGDGELVEAGPQREPIVATISAGGLVESWGEDFGEIPVTWELLRRAPNAKALRVNGISLVSEGINDGDILILDPDAPQREGIIDGKLYAVRSEEHNQTMAARRVFTVGRRRLKLVSGDGQVTEVERSRTTIEGRIIKAIGERDL